MTKTVETQVMELEHVSKYIADHYSDLYELHEKIKTLRIVIGGTCLSGSGAHAKSGYEVASSHLQLLESLVKSTLSSCGASYRSAIATLEQSIGGLRASSAEPSAR